MTDLGFADVADYSLESARPRNPKVDSPCECHRHPESNPGVFIRLLPHSDCLDSHNNNLKFY